MKLIITATDSALNAKAITDHLLENHLAACVQAIPGVSSTYWWKGKLETAGEIILLIKTRDEKVQQLKTALISLHSYEVPELIELEAKVLTQDYENWLWKTLKE